MAYQRAKAWRLTGASMVALLVAAAAAARAAEVYAPLQLPRRGVDFLGGRQFSSRFTDQVWEIKATFKHDNGHLGTFQVGDTVRVSFTVGVVGERASANMKNFTKPVPQAFIFEQGKVKEILAMKRGAC